MRNEIKISTDHSLVDFLQYPQVSSQDGGSNDKNHRFLAPSQLCEGKRRD